LKNLWGIWPRGAQTGATGDWGVGGGPPGWGGGAGGGGRAPTGGGGGKKRATFGDLGKRGPKRIPQARGRKAPGKGRRVSPAPPNQAFLLCYPKGHRAPVGLGGTEGPNQTRRAPARGGAKFFFFLTGDTRWCIGFAGRLGGGGTQGGGGGARAVPPPKAFFPGRGRLLCPPGAALGGFFSPPFPGSRTKKARGPSRSKKRASAKARGGGKNFSRGGGGGRGGGLSGSQRFFSATRVPGAVAPP